MTSQQFLSLTVGLLLTATLSSSCGGGGGSRTTNSSAHSATAIQESEPNDNCNRATALQLGRYGFGNLTELGDLDFWRIKLKAGQTVAIQLFAVSTDLEGWNAFDNHAEVAVFPPGSTEAEYSQEVTLTAWGHSDLDIPRYRAETAGEFCIRVRTSFSSVPGSTYYLRVQPLGSSAVQRESEPFGQDGQNDDANDAETIRPGTMVGYMADGGQDFYAFEISEPSMVAFEVTGYRNGLFRGENAPFDSYLYIRDQDGTTVLVSIDDVFLYDSAANYLFTQSGTYYVQVDTSFGSGQYLLDFTLTPVVPVKEQEPNFTPELARSLSYGDFALGQISPTDTDYYAFEGKAGDMIQIGLFHHDNDSGGGNNQDATGEIDVILIDPGVTTQIAADGPDGDLRIIRAILNETGKHYVFVSSQDSTRYHLQVRKVMNSAFESEPNDAGEPADRFNRQGRASGRIDAPGDVDSFAFQAAAGEVVRIVAHADDDAPFYDHHPEHSGHGSKLYPLLEVSGPGNRTVAMTETSAAPDVFPINITSGAATCVLTFTAPTSGLYRLQVHDARGEGSPFHSYVLERR